MRTIYINSFGGSGSTFLADTLRKIYKNIHFVHIHSGIKAIPYIKKNNINLYTN